MSNPDEGNAFMGDVNSSVYTLLPKWGAIY
jgi:hypothetical protein